MATEIPVRVECYAANRDEARPRRFTLGSRAVTVVERIDQWHGPGYRYFKLRGDDDAIYILRYHEQGERWELIMYDGTHRRAGDDKHPKPMASHPA